MKIKLSPKQISYLVSLVLGIALIIVGLIKVIPGYYYFIALGLGVVCLIYGIYGYYQMKKFFANPINIYTQNEVNKNAKKAKIVKAKIQKVEKIKDDKLHVIATCPNCFQRIRLPNKSGKHEVCCPKCAKKFEVKI